MADLEKDLVRASKFISKVLRHDPSAAGVTLDRKGWVDIDALLAGVHEKGGMYVSREMFDKIVAENDKKRFVVEGNKVRAAQGHSVQVDLGYEAVEPPDSLFHGTATRFLNSIKQSGLQPGKRQHVHLSADIETATKVGQRHGKLAIITIDAKGAHKAGVKFYQADNGVWLSDPIPYGYCHICVV
jgi:putative RNA 2'-phosphotransferase